jgi:signal transduction histidine kinase/BarA-like signal transduction histidine kinase
MKRLRRWMLVMMLCVAELTLNMSFFTVHAIDDPKRVLYISSYSYSWGTVPQQIKGISETLTSDAYAVNYEFMDTKNTSYSSGYQEYYQLLKYKLSQREKYDGVIVADDAALNFVEMYKNELFADTPITFLAVDNISNAEQASQDQNVTGVVEKVDYQKNIEIAQKLLPKAKNITFIFDNKENGLGIASQLNEQSEYFSGYHVSYLNTSEYSKEELGQKLSSFTADDIVFFVSMGQLKDNVILNEYDRYAMVREHASVPFFRLTTAGIGEGALGGYVVDFEKSGEIAASMLVTMMNDPQAAKPAMEYNTPGLYYFDYNILKQYGLNASLLPEEAKIINQPESFWRKYSSQIMIGLLSMLLTAFIIFTILLRRTKKQVEMKNVELTEANRAKTDFLSNMSHDIRTPMNAIMGITTLLQHTKDPKEEEKYVGQIEQSGKYMLSLINDALDMTKIEAGKMTLNPQPVSNREIIENVLATIEPLAQRKPIHLNVEMPSKDDPCWTTVSVDSVRMSQIFMNLLSNAVKFTPAGGTVTMKMEVISNDEQRISCHYVVADTGIGMSEEFQKHLFEPFNQEKREYISHENGTGLGLVIVKKLVDLFGGTIKITSRENQGTTVDLYLTHQKCDRNEEGAVNAVDLSVLAGKHILLCEDNTLNAEIAAQLLSTQGVTTERAENGRIGVDRFLAQPAGTYDAILMDVRMPVMDGLEAARTIRTAKERPDTQTIPIISMTANTFDEDVQRCMDAGMNAHIAKPIDAQLMFETLAVHMQAKK